MTTSACGPRPPWAAASASRLKRCSRRLGHRRGIGGCGSHAARAGASGPPAATARRGAAAGGRCAGLPERPRRADAGRGRGAGTRHPATGLAGAGQPGHRRIHRRGVPTARPPRRRCHARAAAAAAGPCGAGPAAGRHPQRPATPGRGFCPRDRHRDGGPGGAGGVPFRPDVGIRRHLLRPFRDKGRGQQGGPRPAGRTARLVGRRRRWSGNATLDKPPRRVPA